MLDRPGGRWLLTALANQWVRALAGKDAGVCYDGMWLHRVGSYYIPDSRSFSYYKEKIREWGPSLTARIDESKDYWFYAYEPCSGDTILDVGAGIGSDTLAFSEAVGPSGRVYAIEAHPRTYEELCKLIKWNRLSNVSSHCCAIIDEPKTLYIQDNTSHESNAVSIKPAPGYSIGGVPGVPLDAFCASHGIETIDLLKMNIEGAERLAIGGMTQTIARARHVVIACHDFMVHRTGDPQQATRNLVVRYLEENGFLVTVRDGDSRPWVRDHVHAYRRGS